MSNKQRCLEYLHCYASKDLAAMAGVSLPVLPMRRFDHYFTCCAGVCARTIAA